ncbi:hypothetical protein [Pseudomonas sp. G166]|uniref:hypothetical protein n=1 Tax=Pseudomonas sp. G166 TaxID=3094846 RepID=UPI00300A7769
MRLQSDIDALAAIEEDARAMLNWLGLPDDAQKLAMAVFLRQIIDLATYTESARLLLRRWTSTDSSAPSVRGWRDSSLWAIG